MGFLPWGACLILKMGWHFMQGGLKLAFGGWRNSGLVCLQLGPPGRQNVGAPPKPQGQRLPVHRAWIHTEEGNTK